MADNTITAPSAQKSGKELLAEVIAKKKADLDKRKSAEKK